MRKCYVSMNYKQMYQKVKKKMPDLDGEQTIHVFVDLLNDKNNVSLKVKMTGCYSCQIFIYFCLSFAFNLFHQHKVGRFFMISGTYSKKRLFNCSGQNIFQNACLFP